MGNAHVGHGGNSKKTAVKDAVKNDDEIVTAIQESTPFPAAKTAMASVAELTDLQKTLLQQSWKRLEMDIAQVGIIVFINELRHSLISLLLVWFFVVIGASQKAAVYKKNL
ncbi:hypothetical protein OUZ56_007843 [Daphnia magna]|uniref:Uncharacterized protein n=1 Tax=Daphnia magna TaxID=35525 RepID=A0ABR0ABD9_9CRUS|nr:hypothetical protein OUZ56_007843 [Daphnia magna]